MRAHGQTKEGEIPRWDSSGRRGTWARAEPGRCPGVAGGPQKHVCGGLGTTLPGVREARSGREAAPVRRIVGRHVLSETRVAVVRGCRF